MLKVVASSQSVRVDKSQRIIGQLRLDDCDLSFAQRIMKVDDHEGSEFPDLRQRMSHKTSKLFSQILALLFSDLSMILFDESKELFQDHLDGEWVGARRQDIP